MNGKKPRVLCVDDEPFVLEGLKVNLRSAFEVVTAASGDEALALLEKQAPFAVLVSDMRMPRMSGRGAAGRRPGQLPGHGAHPPDRPGRVRHRHPGGQRGAGLPLPHQALPLRRAQGGHEAGVEQHRLLGAERELLEKTLTGAVRALVEVLALTDPAAFGRAERLRRTVVAVADRLSIAATWPIEMAAQLSPLGAVQLPKPLVEKLNAGLALSAAEQQLLEKVSAQGDQLLANIPRMEPVREILSCPVLRSARATGTVTPETTPLGARILLVALHLDTLESSGHTAPQALAVLQSHPGAVRRGDPGGAGRGHLRRGGGRGGGRPAGRARAGHGPGGRRAEPRRGHAGGPRPRRLRHPGRRASGPSPAVSQSPSRC